MLDMPSDIKETCSRRAYLLCLNDNGIGYVLGRWDKRMAEGLSACRVFSMVSSNRAIPTSCLFLFYVLLLDGAPVLLL